MREQKLPVIIFSVYQENVPPQKNYANQRALCVYLTRLRISHEEVVGCYKGRKELSVVVPARFRNTALLLAVRYNQESILEVDNERGAVLTELATAEQTRLGYLVPVSKATALREDAWTLDKRNQYWIVSSTRLQGHLQR